MVKHGKAQSLDLLGLHAAIWHKGIHSNRLVGTCRDLQRVRQVLGQGRAVKIWGKRRIPGPPNPGLVDTH